jgi:hypothetical protein
MLRNVRDHTRDLPDTICCILLAPPFTSVGKNDVIPRLGYLDSRTGKPVHFYCAGYGGYWHQSLVPDMKDIGEHTYRDGTKIPWAFSQTLFATFVNELEASTSWKYSGGADLLMLNQDVDFSQAIVFNIDKMVDDKAVDGASQLFEAIIQFSRQHAGGAYEFSDRKGVRLLGQITVDAILSYLPPPLKQLWQTGRHYAIRNITVST